MFVGFFGRRIHIQTQIHLNITLNIKMKTRSLDIQLIVTLTKLHKKRKTANSKVCSILIDSVDCRLLILKLTSKNKFRRWHLPPSCLKIEPHECQRQDSAVRNVGICLSCHWWEKGIPVMRKLGTKQI